MRLIMKNWKKTLNESKKPVTKMMESDGVNASTDLFTLDISTLNNENLQTALELLEEEFYSLSREVEQAKRFNDPETAAEARADKIIIRKKIKEITKRIEDQAQKANATETPKDDEAVEKIATDAADAIQDLGQIGDTQPTDQEIDDMFNAIATSLDQGEEIVKKAGELEQQSDGDGEGSEESSEVGILDTLKSKLPNENDLEAAKDLVGSVADDAAEWYSKPENAEKASKYLDWVATVAPLIPGVGTGVATTASIASKAGNLGEAAVKVNSALKNPEGVDEAELIEAMIPIGEVAIEIVIEQIPFEKLVEKIPGADGVIGPIKEKAASTLLSQPAIKSMLVKSAKEASEAAAKAGKKAVEVTATDLISKMVEKSGKGVVKFVTKKIFGGGMSGAAAATDALSGNDTEEQPQERQTVTLNNNAPKLQRFANAFVSLSDDQYAQLRGVLSDELEKAKVQQIPWEELPQGLQKFGENTALFMFDESNNGFTLDPEISKIVPIQDEEGNPVTFEITQEEFEQQYRENEETMEKIGEKLEEEGESEMTDDSGSNISPSPEDQSGDAPTTGLTAEIDDATVEEAAKRIKNEDLKDVIPPKFGMPESETPYIDILRGADFGSYKAEILENLGFAIPEDEETIGRFVQELSARIVEAYDALSDADGDSTAEPSPEEKKTMEDRYNKLKPFVAKRLASQVNVDLSDDSGTTEQKFENLKIMESMPFVFFLAQQLGTLKEDESSKSPVNMDDVKQAILANPDDVKFINDNTSDKINIEKMFKSKFGVDVQTDSGESRKDLKTIVADIKQKYEDKMGSLEGIKPFVADLAKKSKGDNGKIDPVKLQAAADEALSNLSPSEEDPVDDVPDEDTTKASGLDDLLQLDGQEFVDALIQFYRDNDLIDKDGVKSGLTTIRSAFKDLPVDAEVFMDEPGDLEDTEEPPSEPSDETGEGGEEVLPEVYIIDEAEETNPVGQAIATITSDSVLPDNIIPFERVPDLRDKLKAVLKVKDEEVKSSEAVQLTSEDLAAVMAAENGKDLTRALLDILKQKFGGEIPEELRKSIKLVLRKEPKAIVNMIDSPLLKMDVLDGEELAKKIAKFYPPEEDFSDNPMMANLDADERKILKFINTVFQNREVSVETSDGKELSFSGKDMKTRYLDSLRAVRSLNKDILPAIVITLNQEATGAVLREEEEELQEFFSSKKSDQTISLVDTVEDVMGRSNPKFVGNYRNMKKAFSGSAFRKFFGDLKKLVNAFMNSELIKIDGEEFDEDDFEDNGDGGDTLEAPPEEDTSETTPADVPPEFEEDVAEIRTWFDTLSPEEQRAIDAFVMAMVNESVELVPATEDELETIDEAMTDYHREQIKTFQQKAGDVFPEDFGTAMSKVMEDLSDENRDLVANVMYEKEDGFVNYLTTIFRIKEKSGIEDALKIIKSMLGSVVDKISPKMKDFLEKLKSESSVVIQATKYVGGIALEHVKDWFMSLMKDLGNKAKDIPNSPYVQAISKATKDLTDDQIMKLKISYAMAKDEAKKWLDEMADKNEQMAIDFSAKVYDIIESISKKVKEKARMLALIAFLKMSNPEFKGEEEVSGYRSQADDLPSSELPTVEPSASGDSGDDTDTDSSDEPITADDFDEGGRFGEYFKSFKRQFEQKSNKNTRIFNLFLSRALERLSKSKSLQEVDEPTSEIELETRVDKVANKFNAQMTKAGLKDEARVVKQLIKNSRTDNKFNEVIMKIYNFDKEVASDPFKVNGKDVGLIEALADVIVKIIKEEKPKKASDKSSKRGKSTYAGDDNYDNNLDMLDGNLEEALKPMIKRVITEMRAAK